MIKLTIDYENLTTIELNDELSKMIDLKSIEKEIQKHFTGKALIKDKKLEHLSCYNTNFCTYEEVKNYANYLMGKQLETFNS